MSPVFAKLADSTKLTPTKGQKLGDLIGADLDNVGLFNWGTKDKAEINRALVELVGCQKVDPDPLKSELDPALVTVSAIYLPKPWTPDGPLAIGKTHTFKLKKRLPMPAVAITELTPWFTPNDAMKKCTIKYRLEGHVARADKTDLEVHVARYRDRKGKTQSSYYEIKETRRETEPSRLAAPDNPIEYNEVPSGTDGAGDTHIWREPKAGVAPSPEVTVLWDGESKATKGVLGPPKSGGGKVYINSTCAPYSVLVRYYKNDDDKAATITFDESFYPRWKVKAGGTLELDPTSLVVRWTVKHGATEKLVLGQLQVFAKDNPIPVCQMALDKGKLDAGELDLATLWPASAVKRDEMPYRVQIQAHSGPDEAEGLAIAVMPTQVRAYDYKQVQFLAFNVKPGSPYMGDLNHDLDIAARCDAMIEAVQKVKAKSNAATDILKVFMAPEFYFRGLEGAYPVEKIETIMPRLRVEADKIEYADWMFVFGSAIGYQKHEATGSSEIVHKAPNHAITLDRISDSEVTMKPSGTTTVVIPEVGWRVVQGTTKARIAVVVEVVEWKEYKLTLDPPTAFVSGDPATIEVPTLDVRKTDPLGSTSVNRILMTGDNAIRIPSATVGGLRWKARQGGHESAITKSERDSPDSDEFWLTLQSPGPFVANSPVELVEPMSTEVTNLALVQKGYPTPHMGNGGLSSVGIYKEKVSPIDFFKTTTDWHKADASDRKITIHATADRPVLPTFGSDDLSGANPNVKRVDPDKGTAGSEINTTGFGGGVVYTMNDITFGLEVCLDHAKNRLANFYADTNTTKSPGDPKVQVHLIPSWGMSIGQGAICCPSPLGTVFNVDGARCESVARVYDGTTWSCDDHPEVVGARGGTCNKDRKYFKCPKCNVYISDSAGFCDVHGGTALVEYSKCGQPTRFACTQGCWGTTSPCVHPSCRPLYKCLSCTKAKRVGESCGCPNPNPYALVCTQKHYRGASCPTCNKTVWLCNRAFKLLGKQLLPNGPAVEVPASGDPYFQRRGSVLAYPPVVLPLPDIVV